MRAILQSPQQAHPWLRRGGARGSKWRGLRPFRHSSVHAWAAGPLAALPTRAPQPHLAAKKIHGLQPKVAPTCRHRVGLFLCRGGELYLPPALNALICPTCFLPMPPPPLPLTTELCTPRCQIPERVQLLAESIENSSDPIRSRGTSAYKKTPMATKFPVEAISWRDVPVPAAVPGSKSGSTGN